MSQLWCGVGACRSASVVRGVWSAWFSWVRVMWLLHPWPRLSGCWPVKHLCVYIRGTTSIFLYTTNYMLPCYVLYNYLLRAIDAFKGSMLLQRVTWQFCVCPRCRRCWQRDTHGKKIIPCRGCGKCGDLDIQYKIPRKIYQY